MSEIIEIPGLAGRFVQVDNKYDYATDKCKCAVCGELGVPWGGWFSCEAHQHYSLVENGRTFVRIAWPEDTEAK